MSDKAFVFTRVMKYTCFHETCDIISLFNVIDFEQKNYNQLILSVNYFLKFLFPNNEFDENLNDVVSMF